MAEKVVAKFAKNATEQVRVTLTEWKGYPLLDVRVYFQDAQGEYKPSRKGLTLNRDLVPELLAGLEAARAEIGELVR